MHAGSRNGRIPPSFKTPNPSDAGVLVPSSAVPLSVTKMTLEHPRLLAASLVACLCSAFAPAAAAMSTFSFQQTPSAQERQERDRALATYYLQQAEQERRANKLEIARDLVLKALTLQPANQSARNLLRAIQRQMGDEEGTVTSINEIRGVTQQVNEERLRANVLARIQAGRAASAEKNYRRAREEFTNAKLLIDRGIDNRMDWGGLDEQVDQLLEEANANYEQQRTEAVTAENAEQSRRLLELRRQQDEARKRKVDAQLREAVQAFENRQFRAAADLALYALELDPTNAMAEELHSSALKAARQEARSQYFAEKAKELRNMLEAYEDLKIPQTDILVLDRAVFDRAMNRSRATPRVVTSPEDDAMRARVAETPTGKLNFNEDTGGYLDVFKTLQTQTGVPIIVTTAGADIIDGEGLVLTIELASSISLESLLDLMVERSEELAWRVKNSVVQITCKEAAGDENILWTYDVRDLIFPRTEFVAPTIRDIPSGDELGGEIPRTGGERDEKIAFVEIDLLMENIRSATDSLYWDESGEMSTNEQGYLVVKANPDMHQKVEGVLADMRRFATSVVTVDTKFLTVTRNFLQEVGVDFRGLGGTGNKGTVATLDDLTNGLQNNTSRGLDNNGTGDPAGSPSAGAFFNDGGDGDVRARTENFFQNTLGSALSANGGLTASLSILDDLQIQAVIRAIEKNESSEVVNSQILTVLNNERGHVAVINQTAYVRDFDVEVAQASFVADPKVDVIQDGIVLDVRPVVRYDRKFIQLTLEPTVAELTRPIPTFTTSLAGSTLPVTLQLPNLTVTTFATTANVPDGGSVLIGGLRQVLNRERRAEIPLLANLPLISFFFKNEGVVDENRQLMVMVQAWITDVRELTSR